jgi:hypothetical protein
MANTYRLWFRQTYQLAPTDPRYLAASDEDIQAEYWAYEYQKGGVKEEYEDEGFDKDAAIREAEERAEARERAAREAALAAAATVPDVAAAVDDWEEVEV